MYIKGFLLRKLLHQLFSEHRINPKREFFKIDPEKVVLAISIGNFKEITPGVVEMDTEEQKALSKVKDRRPRLKLEALGIKSGDELVFSRDENIKATVATDGKVVFQNEIVSLSAAALQALHSLGYNSTNVNGAVYWMFEGELLDERRQRIESEQFNQNE